MNSDYVLKGRGQITLQQPDWAKFTPSSAARGAAPVLVPASEANSPLPTQTASPKSATKSAGKSAASDTAPDITPEPSVAKQARMNEFTHGGSKKTVGPEVDNVDYSFSDFLDTINPLQQIPVVNMIYRELSGEKISGVAQVMGSALYWGPMGIVTGAIDAIFEQEKGGDMGETIMASLLGTETPNAKNLPSNNPHPIPGKNPITDAPTTMLADAAPAEVVTPEAAPVAVAAAPVPTRHKIAAKQPFGGVMGTQTDAPVANIASNTAEPTTNDDVAETPKAVSAPPVQHTPIEAEGHKLYSLAGIVRHVGSPSRMPIHEAPDARLKAYGKMSASAAKPDPAALLGLQNPSASVAAAPSFGDDELPTTRLPDPGFSAPLNMGSDTATPSGNPIPAQLIQDMMMNMQKYQNDMKNGTLRGSSLDVNG
ncbi:MAG: hypothetical protein K2Q32_03245 [Alphaproteobacteria bacterium]|nr:hypothetical protein [Alphaproteobacteria bacterium]